MLNFETSCIHRLLHNEHENLIWAKKSFIEKKDIKKFWSKMKVGKFDEKKN